MARDPKKPKDDQEELTPEERELFLDAFFQGSEFDSKKYEATLPQTFANSVEALDDAERALFLRAVEDGLGLDVRAHKLVVAERPRGLPARNKKKELVDAVLDLHGYATDSAIAKLERFLEREKLRGSRTLLVVHGKGTGILKSAVWTAVDGHPLVDDFQMAAGRLGGQGAIVIRMNRRVKRK